MKLSKVTLPNITLPNVTLVAVTSKDYGSHVFALEQSKKNIDFGAVMLLDLNTHSIDEWNKAIIYELWKYIRTEFALLIHADGYVINPELWNPKWLDYDYIGAPWPLPKDDYSYRDEKGDIVRVGNSVSLRSFRLMQSARLYPWQSFYGNTNEDGFICCHHRKDLESKGIRFAPLEVAKHFSKEHDIPENKGLITFAFHSL